MTRTPLTHAELAQAIQSLRLGTDASDLHGSLTGFLCAGGRATAPNRPTAMPLVLSKSL